MADWTLEQESMGKHASAVIAPLNTSNSPERTRGSVFSHTRQSSSRGTHSTRSQSQSQISPPLTPKASNDAMVQPLLPQPAFHNYLRAFYHYNASTTVSSSTDESSITISIKQGDVILVHSVHPNGWADGTLLASGARGWLPTNYCEPYDHPAVRNLLNALTQLWDFVREGENGDLIAFTRQDYIRAMIAGVRCFLERTDCLSRDSRLIVAHVGLRRMRKGLLGDLSSLVKTAKRLQKALQLNDADVPMYEYLDDLVLKSFKLVTRSVRFLDIWATDAVSLSAFELGDTVADRPMTPPSDNLSAAAQQLASPDDVAVTQKPLSTPEDWSTSSTRPIRNLNRLSAAFPLPSEADSLQTPAQFSPPRSLVKCTSLTHRLSYTRKSHAYHTSNLASERLETSRDAFLGFIGSFIGSHLQSRSSDELAHIIQQSVEAGRKLLTVVDEVWERDARRTAELEDTRETMYARLTELVQATKDMFSEADGEMVGDPIADESDKQLVLPAMSCVRAAEDCVTKARVVIERIGDFEFEVVGLGLSEAIFEQLPSASRDCEIHHSPSKSITSTAEIDKPLPAPPTPERHIPPPLVISESKPLPDVPQASPLGTHRISLRPSQFPAIVESPMAMSFRSSRSSLPPVTAVPMPEVLKLSPSDVLESPIGNTESVKTDSVNASVTDSGSNFRFSIPDSGSVKSHASTRATTPDHSPLKSQSSQTMLNSFGSSSELRSLASEDVAAGEEHLLETTFVHEIVYNKDGQISGGSLSALVEQLTTHESTPDAVFVTTFYLTFRLFTTSVDLAQCLIDRFEYVGDSQAVGVLVRLRIYNVFKGWLESHWSSESDSAALGIILSFATGMLRTSLPAAGKHLAELTAKVTEIHAGVLVPRVTSLVGKTGISNTVFTQSDSSVPPSVLSKSQLNVLKANKEGKAQCSILDFDPLELARQFTIIESRLFCSIQPEELLALEWTKKSDSKAVNVKAMSTLSTDLANLVADTILQLEDAKKRAVIIKQWIKIAAKCLELNNYDSLMAIICSLNSSMVTRLKKTWDLVSAKNKARLEELKSITDVGRNYAILRQRLHNHVAPCIPFVGIYLTDLTFIDVGNGTTRQLPAEEGEDRISVINFDKHMKTAKIISQFQSFQVPYRLAAIPEMQDWMDMQIQRVRSSDQANVSSYYRRSLLLEPREMQHSTRGSPSIDNSAQNTFTAESRTISREKFDFLNFNFSSNNLKST